MPQPNKGNAAPGAPTSQPIMDKTVKVKDAGHVKFGHTSGGTKGSGTGTK